MTKKMLAPSVLSADFGRLAEEVRAVEKAGADLIHIDVMDGHFVPNITIGPVVVQAIKKATSLPCDVHLMIQNPQDYIESFIYDGASWVSIHAEEGYHLDRTLNLIKKLGAKAGVAINPATPLELIYPALHVADFVLVMTVNPGFGGQHYIEYCSDKIKTLKKYLGQHHPEVLIEVDGGVKLDNIKAVSDCGVDVFVSGSGVFQTKNYQETLTRMRQLIGA